VNSLSSALRDYVSIRRNLGFHFRLPASLLKKFVAFLEGRGASYITAELALAGRRSRSELNLQPGLGV